LIGVNAIALIRLQLELEGIGATSDGLLFRIPGPDPDDISRFYVTQHEDGYTVFTRQDVPRHIRKQLAAIPPARAFSDHEVVRDILAQDAPSTGMSMGITYVLPDTLAPGGYPDVVRLGESHRALIEQYDPKLDIARRAIYAIITDRQIVSTCESSRENARAGEAWVRTRPEYRRHGYARQVTAAWAHNLQQQGKIPFYSHLWDNLASQALAQSLGLIQRFAGVGYG
jgi:GNAT superfamily N-acetyltransferase